MKKLSVLILFLMAFNQFAFSQSDSKYLYEGIWTEKDNGISVLKWTFHSTGTFNQIAFWNNGNQIGSTINSGLIEYDKIANTINFTYKNYAITKNETLEQGATEKKIQWKIKSISENEIVISRPVNKELEKQLKSYDGANVDIVLTRNVKLPY